MDPAPASNASPEAPVESLAHRYTRLRATTEALCAPLSAEDAALQSMPDASPAKWHLAHTGWFFETFVLLPGLRGYTHFDPRYEMLFNSYYRSVGEPYPRPRRGLLSRPSLEEVLRYRRHVDAAMGELLAAPHEAERSELLAVVELGLQHELQHQELLLTDVKHLLHQNPLRPAYRASGRASAIASAAARLDFVPWPGGFAGIGHAGPGFAFDNEGPRHRRWLEPFALATRLVTNGEWMAFMADRGYERPELWLSDGFEAVTAGGWRAPLYWERDGQGFSHFTLDGLQPVRAEEPVCHVSAYEADAFARWAGARLPGEDEWEVMAADRPVEGNFVESARLRPATAREMPLPAQLFGDVWEWTRSAYAAYPGYTPPPGALGEYNGKFMCNQLVLRGGSCATPRSHVRASYRNFFPPGARWQFSGVRLARDAR